jgi:hypothetical protein
LLDTGVELLKYAGNEPIYFLRNVSTGLVNNIAFKN